MISKKLSPLLLAIALISPATAQLAASLRVNKQQYLAGEPVIATVTVTNHAGQPLTFAGDGRRQWLNFMIKDSRGNPINPRGRAVFGKMTIKAGETLAREVDLTQHFMLAEPGTISVGAVIRMPGDGEDGSATNRVLFNQSPGRTYWTQAVGMPGKSGETRQFKVLNFAGDQKDQIYAQVLDNRTGQNVRTFLLGDVLSLRKPSATVDRQQHLHVMFLATPTMWVHCQVDPNGKLVNREIHQRGDQGDPQLLTFGDGSVRVANSTLIDQKAALAAKAKVRKASDRPNAGY